MSDKWQVVDRNIAICEKCNGGMALWYDTENEIYCISCDYCDNEVVFKSKDMLEKHEKFNKGERK